MAPLDFKVFDADNHYYEAEDAFTRHMDRRMRSRCMQWADVDGKRRLLVGGRVNKFIPNPTFDPVARPGTLVDYFRGRGEGGKGVIESFGELEPIRAEYRDRDARLTVMDEQSLEACWLFPTLGVGMEVALRSDPQATMFAFSAFNRWLDDDWGFAYRNRIFAAPYITLVDVDAAITELDWVLARDARVVCMIPGPASIGDGTTSPFTEAYDEFWARVDEAGITVAIHAGDAGYSSYARAWEPRSRFGAFFGSPLLRVMLADRPIYDTLAAMICHRLFDRFPRLRIASIENGAGWVKPLLKKLELAAHQTPGWFGESPTDTFHRHVWVSPFWEDDPVEAAEVVGVERTLFGSDWPHTEGIPDPIAYADELAKLDEDSVRRIMSENAYELTGRLS